MSIIGYAVASIAIIWAYFHFKFAPHRAVLNEWREACRQEAEKRDVYSMRFEQYVNGYLKFINHTNDVKALRTELARFHTPHDVVSDYQIETGASPLDRYR
ncbi:hypothetical protein [Paraburkholderia saeva]|uniref:hypothetical protein n=1 Tax=Paraburkholderia saeva TaxID=2777537 RepID=UPI001D93D12A|nr:hypothetical protein [Paraburkholderia saeva]CAG4914851.1 hypothetical protein R70241_04280 [Paraburkholderia saeva]